MILKAKARLVEGHFLYMALISLMDFNIDAIFVRLFHSVSSIFLSICSEKQSQIKLSQGPSSPWNKNTI